MGKRTIKKVLKRGSIISLSIAIVAILSLVFVIKYRIKSVIKEVVRQETKGVYELDFSKISIDFIKGRVKLNAVDLKPAPTYPDKKDYRLTIGHLYFSLASWNQLLFHRKLFVDSLVLNAPDLTIFQRLAQKNNNGLTPIQEIFRSLENISETFKVHVLEINSGRVDVYRKTNDAPVIIDHISFRIENFGQKKKNNTHLRYADNVTLNIARQHWVFSSGQVIKFGNLFFSGKDQTFLVDSCSISMAPDNRGHRTSLFAEKLLFRTNELVSVFDKNELNIDTLYCKSPVLSVAMPADKKDNDTVSDLNESIHQLPVNVNIKFINIENGQIHLASADNKRSYTGKKTNLKIYGLNLGHNPVPVIHTGRIDLNLHEISFATRDSLYLLTVNEFRFDSNNLVCRNAILKPSAKAKGYLKSINLPAFTLIDISLNDLLEKRLKALVAVIDKPQFFFASRTARKKAIEYGIPVNKFYNTIKDLAQLIDVHWLTIKDGTLDYNPLGSSAPELSLKNIDVEINLGGLLNSSSIRETRQSIHTLSIGSINLAKDKINADLNNFFIDGSREIGTLGSLAVQLSAGIRFKAANLYWEGFSWEDFVRNKSIHIDTLNIPSLGFWAWAVPGERVNNTGGLHPLSINKLNIGEAVIDVKTVNNAEVRTTAGRIAIEGLHTAGNAFFWQKLHARADSIFFRGEHKQLAVQQLNLTTDGESALQNMQYRDSTNKVTIPEVKFQLRLNNSAPEELEFPFLSIYRPEIIVSPSQQGRRPVTNKLATGFTPFRIGKLNIIDGFFKYQPSNGPLNVSTRFSVHTQSGGMEKSNKNALVFNKVILNVDSLTLAKPVMHGLLEIRDLRGGLTGYPLTVNFNSDNVQLKDLINSLYITGGRLLYNDSTSIVSVSNITGNGKAGALGFRDVSIRPKNSLKTFLNTSLWQKDYLSFRCDSIGLQHINNLALLNDTVLAIRRIYLQNPHLSSFRNKNIAFQHGIEKLMPTKLLAALKIPVQIDSVQIKGASVDVHEVSVATKREGIVQLRDLNATLKKIVSRPTEHDSLVLEVMGQVLNYKIRAFRYAESYHDSLSGFTMQYGISPMQLSHLTEVTNPLSAIAITNGQADTLYATLSGNKYAASGELDFYYHNLKVRLLNKEDTLKKSVLLSLKTLLANGLIRSNNQKQARLFFIRDRERFVFNYWVKTLFSGFVTSTGLKRNRKYDKLYKEAAKKYSMPAVQND
jgi:hypothetical protein